MSNHRSVHLNSGLLPLTFAFAFSLFSFCFAFIKPALSCSAVSWYERTEKKRAFKDTDQLVVLAT